MSGYGQYCPVAKAAEILDQRWMLLVVRELIAGSDRFNDIHRGVPRMSRTLLSKRLKQLTAEGLVDRREQDDGPVYGLTTAGEQLRPLIEILGEWGVRWIDSLADDDLDPAFLLWDMHRSVNADALPEGQTVLALTFHGLAPDLRDWWLLLRAGDVEICDHDPGFDTDVAITSPIRTFVRVWRGDLSWDDALRAGTVELHGPTQLRRQIPAWFHLSHFASVPR
jgi:DNA-binding HxlR family transcriptional regulator